MEVHVQITKKIDSIMFVIMVMGCKMNRVNVSQQSVGILQLILKLHSMRFKRRIIQLNQANAMHVRQEEILTKDLNEMRNCMLSETAAGERWSILVQEANRKTFLIQLLLVLSYQI